MTAGAQRLQIVDAVSSQRKGHDVVHQYGSGQPSALGTVPAQRLRCQHGVADALPVLVVTALVSGQAIVRQTIAPVLSAMGAAAVADHARAGPVSTRSIHGIASERSAGAGLGAALPACSIATEEGACAGFGAAWPACRFASKEVLEVQPPIQSLPPPPLF